MRTLDGRTAIVTGASRSIGLAITRTLVGEGMNLVLVARSAAALDAVAAELQGNDVGVLAVPMDVTDPEARASLVNRALAAFGAIDVLVNNAAQVTVTAYHQLTADYIAHLIAVNLTAPMLLAQLVLPHMLAQGRGHLVMLGSVASKSGVAYLEPYGATKAGLAVFAAALRASYRTQGVSASVICPGLVEGAGMYHKVQQDTGVRTPVLLGASSLQQVAQAVRRAILQDLPEVIVNPRPLRPLFALQALTPRFIEWLTPKLGADVYMRAGQIYARGARARSLP